MTTDPNAPQSPQPQVVIQQKSNKGCWIAAAIVVGLAILIIGGCAVMGGLFVAGAGKALEEVSDEIERSNAIPEEITPLLETATTAKFAVSVTQTNTAQSLKSGFLESTPATGGMYVTVLWTYKNITAEPIGSFSTPSIYLLSPEGTRYEPDIDASGTFAAMSNADEKILSDLNPGIQVRAADAFEVSRDLYESGKGEWKILVDGDTNLVFPAP